MAQRRQKLTVIVVPQTGKRTFSFRIAPVWFTFGVLLVAAMAGTIAWLAKKNKELQQSLVELEELKRINRLQQSKIDEMTLKAQQTQAELDRLYQLERQIRKLTEPMENQASRREATDTVAKVAMGRGGPQTTSASAENLPTLSAMLPPDVTAHLFGKRDTLQLHLRKIAAYDRSSETTLSQADATNRLLTQQLAVMDRLEERLVTGKTAIVNHLDYLAHRPTGLPVTGARISDPFGWRWSPFGWGRQFHNGIDFAHDWWEPVVATGDGVVVHAGPKSGGYGYAVIVDHGYGFRTLYAHLIDWNVKVGQQIKRGEVLGWVGSTGYSTGPHLHYEIHLNGVPVDPMPYLQ